MTNSSDQPGIAWAGDDIVPLLLEFRYALPHIACDGLYPVGLDRAAEQARFMACRSLCGAIAEQWSAHYQKGPVSQPELASLQMAVRQSGLGLTGAELEWLLSALGVHVRARITHRYLH
jgi:hypothetical protein